MENTNIRKIIIKANKRDWSPVSKKPKFDPFSPPPAKGQPCSLFQSSLVKNMAFKVLQKAKKEGELNFNNGIKNFVDSIKKSSSKQKIFHQKRFIENSKSNKNETNSNFLFDLKLNENIEDKTKLKEDIHHSIKNKFLYLDNLKSIPKANLSKKFSFKNSPSKKVIIKKKGECNILKNCQNSTKVFSTIKNYSKNNLLKRFSELTQKVELCKIYSLNKEEESELFNISNGYCEKINFILNRRNSSEFPFSKIGIINDNEPNFKKGIHKDKQRANSLIGQRIQHKFQNIFAKNCYGLSQSGKKGNICKTNQDKYIFLNSIFGYKNFDIFGVLDGHGEYGHLVTKFVKSKIESVIGNYNEIINIVNKINVIKKNKKIKTNCLYFSLRKNDIYDIFTNNNYSLLLNFFYDLDLEIKKEKVDGFGSGCTCVLVYRFDKNILCSNIGDSRAILVNYNSANKLYFVTPLSKDHKPFNPEEKKRIIRKGGEIRADSSGTERFYFKGKDYPGMSVTRALGDHDSKAQGLSRIPEFFEIEYTQQMCFIIVASDGIWEYLSNEEVMNLTIPYYETNDTKGAVNNIIIKAKDLWKKNGSYRDDITCLVYFFK